MAPWSVPARGSDPGAPTNSEPLLIGCYYHYTERFHGALDEITVWNRALTTNEIQTLKNRPLAGNETNLVAYWRLDEGTGTTRRRRHRPRLQRIVRQLAGVDRFDGLSRRRQRASARRDQFPNF